MVDEIIMVTAVILAVGVMMFSARPYFAVCFSVLVEAINLRVRRAAAPVHLHAPYMLCNHVGTGISFSGKRTNRAVGGML